MSRLLLNIRNNLYFYLGSINKPFPFFICVSSLPDKIKNLTQYTSTIYKSNMKMVAQKPQEIQTVWKSYLDIWTQKCGAQKPFPFNLLYRMLLLSHAAKLGTLIETCDIRSQVGTAAYQLGNTSSRTITEVKQRWARLVLGWATVQVLPECCC